jgi:hypothetical protein
MEKKKKISFPKKAALCLAFLAAAVPFAHQVMPEFNGSQSNTVWEQTARTAMQPEFQRRQHTEYPELVSIKTPFGGKDGAFAKKEVTFRINRLDHTEGAGKEEVIVPLTQQKAFGPIEADKSKIMFTETSYGDEGAPAILKSCGFDALNKDGSLKKECPHPPFRG